MIKLYDQNAYEECMEVFDFLPLAALVNGRYLAMHGGISQRLTSIEAINNIERRMEPPDDTLLADLMWADPIKCKRAQHVEYVDNTARGISVMFGRRPLRKLLD